MPAGLLLTVLPNPEPALVTDSLKTSGV